ncbi:hypothetical protein BDQ17DRAFT_1425281 [Cyathus striatus]|nr:hypothetical protein BDQ17DRAFT_1425281 [Cyathus striatus]
MTNLTALPVELLQRIAYYVKFDHAHLRTLKSVSLVCQYLKPIFQEYLFSKVILDEHMTTTLRDLAVNRFFSAVETSPHLLSYTRTLSIPMSDKVIHALLYASKLQKLQITVKNCSYPDTFASSLGKLPIIEIYLENMRSFPLSDPPFLSADEQPIYLETLQLYLDSDTLQLVTAWLLDPRCTFNISRLKRLYLNADLGSCDDCILHPRQITQKCATSVESLSFDLIPSDNSSPVVDLSIFSKLITLQVRIVVFTTHDAMWTKHAFHNIHTNTIQSIFMDLQCDEEFHDIAWVYDIFPVDKIFSKTKDVYITVYESNSFIIGEVLNDIKDKYVDNTYAHNIKLVFDHTEAEYPFLKFVKST